MSTYFIDELYPNVAESLNKKENSDTFKNGIDRFLANNIEKLNVLGPLKEIAFPQRNIDEVVRCVGLTDDKIDKVAKIVKKKINMKTDYTICTNPFYVSLTLATRFFILQSDEHMRQKNTKEAKKDEEQIQRCIYYMSVSIYALLQKKYFKKCEPNESVMTYAISNMIEKNRIKQTGSMLDTVYTTAYSCYEFYRDRIRVGEDDTFIRYINDVRTRLNSIMRNISNAYYEAFEKRQYIRTEVEDMSDESYYEADSNSQFIERTTNKVVQTLITNGPDMKLIEIAAKNNSVSVADLRSYVVTICTEKQVNELKEIIESLLILFFNSESSRNYTVKDIGTNKFLLFAFDIYKKSNTKNPQILKIKTHLDKWLEDLHVYERTGTVSTVNNHRRAIYVFLVMETIKLNK